MDFKVEKNIPIPPRSRTGLADCLRAMEIGDSFLVPDSNRVIARNTALRVGIKITTRADGSGMVRVWRTD